MTENGDVTTQDLHRWFFQAYLPNWAGVGASELDPEVMLTYWGVPMHIAGVGWLLTTEAAIDALRATQGEIKDSGYAHTSVIDYEITVYNDAGGSVDAILSRRRLDESEIQRVAAHFEIHRTRDGWRIVAVATAAATANSVAEVWRRIAGPPPRERTGSA